MLIQNKLNKGALSIDSGKKIKNEDDLENEAGFKNVYSINKKRQNQK